MARESLLAALGRDEGEVPGSQAFVDVLLLCRTYGAEAVRTAVEESMRHPRVTLGLVRFYIWQQRKEQAPQAAALDYAGPPVRQGSPGDYAVLQGAAEVGLG